MAVSISSVVTIVAIAVPGTARRIRTTLAASPACAGATALPATPARCAHSTAPRGTRASGRAACSRFAQARAWQTEPSSWQATATTSRRQST